MPAKTGIDIRPGRQADTPDVVNLSKRTLRVCYTPFLGQTSVEAWIADVLDGYVRDHLDDSWVATDKGTVCGYCVVTGRLLALLLVDVREQGRGIGTLLLRHSEKLVFRSYAEIWLESFVPNDRANAFYSKRGWSRGSRHLDAKSGVDVWKFSKRKGWRLR